LATDTAAAFTYLRTRSDVIDVKKIGLVGHSEGGLIAPIVASQNKDVAFTVLLAGPGVDGAEILKPQSRRALELAKAPEEMIVFNDKVAQAFEIIQAEKNETKMREKLSVFMKGLKGVPDAQKSQFSPEGIEKQLDVLTEPWLVHFIRSDPQDFLSKTKCPTLAINGSKDFQVLPKLNLDTIAKGLKKAKNKDFKIVELEGLNHLFQTAETGALSEYAAIEETVSPVVLELVEKWISKRFAVGK
jgi:hypothetical protein